MIRALPLAILLLLGGCGGGGAPDNGVDTLDAQLARANATDPAVTAALQDQIMVDPTLTAQANGDAVRPPDRPYSATTPAPTVAAGSAAPEESLQSAPAPGACPVPRRRRRAPGSWASPPTRRAPTDNP